MAKRSISVLALFAQLMLFIALCSDAAEGLLEKNWRQCVYKNLNDGRDTGLIKVWIWIFPKTKLLQTVLEPTEETEGEFLHPQYLIE